MHKTRHFLPPLPDFVPGAYDLYNPKLRFIAVPKKDLKITFNFEILSSPLLHAAAKNAGKPLVIPDGHIIVPVHELQVPHIKDKFPDLQVYSNEYRLDLRAQQSIR